MSERESKEFWLQMGESFRSEKKGGRGERPKQCAGKSFGSVQQVALWIFYYPVAVVDRGVLLGAEVVGPSWFVALLALYCIN